MAAGVLLTSVRVECNGLTLRSPLDDDIDPFMAVYDDDFDLRPQPRPAIDRAKVPDAMLQRIRRHRQPQDRDNWRLELVVEAQPGAVLGWALLEPDNDFGQLRVESSSWVAPPYRRKKNGTAVRHGLLALAFTGLRADVALSRAQPGNGSNSISESLEYVRGETTYSTHRRRVAYQNWSLTRQAWEQMARPDDVLIGGHEPFRDWLAARRLVPERQA